MHGIWDSKIGIYLKTQMSKFILKYNRGKSVRWNISNISILNGGDTKDMTTLCLASMLV